MEVIMQILMLVLNAFGFMIGIIMTILESLLTPNGFPLAVFAAFCFICNRVYRHS